MIHRRTVLATGAAFRLTPAASAQVHYPAQPIRLIVPQSAASPSDIVARRLADHVAPVFGVPVVVENRTGASGTIGTGEVARAKPDGHSLLVTVAEPLISGPALMKVPYEPRRDFEFLSKLAVSTSGSVLVASPNLRVNTLAELVSLARSSSRPLAYPTFGAGSFPQLILESLARQAGIRFTAVPYRGSPPALQDLLGGLLDIGMFSVLQSEPLITSGRIEPLAIVGASSRLPKVPTLAQSGFNAYVFRNKPWVGLLAPAAAPPAVTQAWRRLIESAKQDRAFRQATEDIGFDTVGTTSQRFRAEFDLESKETLRLIRELGIQP